jgi:thiamine-monophosphate kinase
MTGSSGGSGEDDLIARYFRPIARAPGALNLIDDAAVLQTSGDDLVVTADAIVEGVHFRAGDSPGTVARKALRVNLSDLAAKGAEPQGFVMTLALRRADAGWLEPFARALGEDADAFGCPLLGGDTVATPGPISISITAFGRVAKGKMIRRFGAGAGEAVLVSGTIGDAAAGLFIGRHSGARERLPAADVAFLDGRYLVPQPRVALAPVLNRYARASIDISDGLAGDLAKLCAASGVSADIRVADIPLSEPAARLVALDCGMGLAELVSQGDDYEIAFTVADEDVAACVGAAGTAGVPVRRIGTIVPGKAPPRFIAPSGQELTFATRSFSHF